MNITVFGGSGFLGSHAADVLTDRGHKVLIFDKIQSQYLRENQEMIVGDILDKEAVHRAVAGADAAYNFIALADLDEANVDPIKTAQINIIGNTLVLEACKNANVKRFIFASSIYVYSDAGSFYRCSKQSAELFIENYQKAYGLDYTILRYGSLYGERCDEKNWIYKMLKQALLDGKISREGNGEEIREYIHVRDAAKLTADILKDEFKNRSVIITGREQIKMKDLLTMVKEMLKNSVEIEFLDSQDTMHYEITPYVFNPKVALKIHTNEHIDLGQGMLDILTGLHAQHVGSQEFIKLPEESSTPQSYV